MEKQKVWEQKLKLVNWMLKNRGFEIVGIHGARSRGFYDAQASKGLQWILDNFEKTVAFLEKHPNGIRITHCCCFKTKQLSGFEADFRREMNKAGMGEVKPEFKCRKVAISVETGFLWHKDDKTKEYFVAKLLDGKEMFEVCVDKNDKTLVRFGTYKGWNNKTNLYEADWEKWQKMDDLFSFKYDDLKADRHCIGKNRNRVIRKMKKYLHEAWAK